MAGCLSIESADEFMKDMVSIKARYPGLQGLVLYNKVVEHWQLKGVARLRFFGPDQKPLLSRHPLNQNRGQGQILEQYTAGVLRYGLQPHCRGRAIAVPKSMLTNPDSEHQEYYLVGHATPGTTFDVDSGRHAVDMFISL